jgi:hypothetical protein
LLVSRFGLRAVSVCARPDRPRPSRPLHAYRSHASCCHSCGFRRSGKCPILCSSRRTFGIARRKDETLYRRIIGHCGVAAKRSLSRSLHSCDDRLMDRHPGESKD